MNMFKNLIEVSSANTKIYEFFYFGTNSHKIIRWTKQGCDNVNVLKPLEEDLFECKKSYKAHRDFFMNTISSTLMKTGRL